MTTLQLANLVNLTGIVLVLFFSAVVGRHYPAVFFRRWTVAYLFNFLLIAMEQLYRLVGRHEPLVMLQMLVCCTASWLFMQTARDLQGRPFAWRAFWAYLAGMLVISQISQATMHSLEPAVILAVLTEMAGYVWLGIVMLRRGFDGQAVKWLGYPLLINALIPFGYPFTKDTPFFWVGFFAAGVGHLIVGFGMIVFLLDEAASKLRGTAAELETKNAELLRADAQKTQILSTIGHELKTPLTAIKGAMWILKAENKGASTPTTEMVTTQVERLSRLIEDALNLSRVAVGKMHFDLRSQDLGQHVASVVNSMMPTLTRRPENWTLAPSADTIILAFDSDRLTQVLVNLLANALKFAPEGTITIRVLRDKDEARIEVHDTGIGIPADQLERIFERFHQVSEGDGRASEGSGLGLAICKAIVERGHNGRIWAESELGKGSTFIVALPLTLSRDKSPQPVAVG